LKNPAQAGFLHLSSRVDEREENSRRAR